MKAVRVHQVGGPEALVYEEVDDPRAGPGQAVVRIEAAGLNFIDVYHRTGFYKLPVPPPFFSACFSAFASLFSSSAMRSSFEESPPSS